MISDLVKENGVKITLNSIVGAFSAFFSIWLISLITDDALEQISTDLVSWTIKFLIGLVSLFVVSSFANYLMTKLSIKIIFEVRSTLVKRILNTPYAILDRIGGHKVQASLTSDVSDISRAISTMPQFIYHVITVIACFGFLAFKSIELFIVTVVILPFGLLITRYFISRAEAYDEIYREDYDSLHEQFKSLVDGVKELNNNEKRKHSFFNRGVLPSLEKINISDLKSEIFWKLNENWGQILLFLVLGTLLFSHVMWGIGKGNDILTFIFIMTFLLGPVDFILSSQETIIKALISLRKIDRLQFSENLSMDPASSKTEEFREWSQISLRSVSFQYAGEGNSFSVGPINLEIQRGEIIIIKGGNGSGKSTFAKLLIGLLNQSNGDIFIDNKLINKDNRDNYLNMYSVIHSDFYLFDTVINRKGELADDELTRQYLNKLDLAGKVTVKNGKLSTTKLSHGQRKRLALVISYLEDAPIYLFDEWAADQDPNYRGFFYNELLAEMKLNGKTVIVISHDDKYFHVADRVITMDNGLVESIEINNNTPK
ncbi:cyclic peptide export ABC transporter [Xenorhabdus nematophila]|uniref:Transport proteins (ABC superfamily, membrane (N-terminal), atp_bind (C-terminal)) n=3 Tax=Xenorhabdus nematophila TaxID=628 RepID=D3VGT6_XENNA|nr:cyclic peptide export ABC transporter [Xenorhabdus nematophila]CEE94687.1 putative transport proteins (ABC superfamily, membrane (N-terminal), atp_bind (C-terminal)) [Xenorhabdus nematophila str. Anatoliense]CEF31713.1 putative transport proteins (ABC superfamily, membrane (N-terminal), atp_bind (C-terminal)) [Xenorhabdus nematophila str. Websteri]AYA40119.1 cyclic peptide export ABC transporter [Xenorhabdus nematophila]MBA0018768.1 cyclic peptide export ABC transporter [Xenorhabdus nematoph